MPVLKKKKGDMNTYICLSYSSSKQHIRISVEERIINNMEPDRKRDKAQIM